MTIPATTNRCPRCNNDLSKDCVVYVFAFHWTKHISYECPGDPTPLFQCPCGLWLHEDGAPVNVTLGSIEKI